MQAMEISRTGLDVEWRRLEIISENLANMNSTRIGTAPLYRERQLVSGPKGYFRALVNSTAAAGGIDPSQLAGVDIYGIQESDRAPHLVHEPGNPLADAQGMVAYPNVDHAAQMLQMVKTSRAYEANMVALAAARQMYAKALDLGRR